MEDKKAIFESVLSRMIESFAPQLFLVLADFETQNSTIQSTSDSDQRLEQIFKRFPRKYPQYKSMLLNLSNLAESNSGQILHYVVRIFKHILKGARDTPFSILQGISTSYDPNNRHHILLFYYFSLFTMTDFICQIVANYGPGETAIQIYRAGYTMATSEPLLPGVSDTLIQQWAVIFSIVSETQFSSISVILTYFNSLEDYTLPMSLIQYLRLDSDDSAGPPFMAAIVSIVKQQHKKKMLNGKILEALASLIITLPGSEKILQKLYNLAYSLRHDKTLSSSAILLLCVVSIRYPKIWNKHTHIFQKRVLSVVGVKSKVKKALHTFRLLMYGLNLDPKWYFWQWGPNPRVSPLVYIQWNGSINIPQTDARSFSGVFMANFFEKSDFSVCPKDFRDVLVHLASLDFPNFLSSIVPKFLSLPTEDPRFITFLMVVPRINSKDFITFAFKPVTQDQIDTFNAQIKPKIMNELSIYEKKQNKKFGICTTILNEFTSSLIEDSDQKMSIILSEWNLNQFGALLKNHVPSKQKNSNFNVVGRLLPAVQCLLSPTDISDITIIKLMVQLSYHHRSAVSINAYDICKNILGTNQKSLEQYIEILRDNMMKDSCPEAIFTCISLLHDALMTFTSENIEGIITNKLLTNIECICLLMLSSIYPDTRHKSYLALIKINKLLKNNGLIHYISPYIHEIEKKVKVKLLLSINTIKPEPISFPTDKIDFETAQLSHYYEIWIFFLAEIMAILIGSNYTPIFKEIEKIRNQILDTICNTDSNETTRTPSDIGFLTIVMSSMYYMPRLDQTEYANNLYEPFSEKEDSRKLYRDTIVRLLKSDNDMLIEMGFTLLQHTHITLYPLIFDILNNFQSSSQTSTNDIPLQLTTTISQSTATIAIMVKNPELSKSFFKQCFPKMTHFLNNLQFLFVQLNLNGPRIIQWDNESELRVTRNQAFVKSYCSVISTCFSRLPKSFHDDEWLLSARENVFRQLLNWSMTTSPLLDSVRIYASNALRSIIRVGSYFNDSLLFDEKTVSFFGRLEIINGPVLSNLLKFHLDLLLNTFVTATYTQPRTIADAYIEAIIENMTPEHDNFLAQMAGPIILLALVSSVREDPRALTLINKFIDATDSTYSFDSEHIREMLQLQTPLIEILPKAFTSMTESVFNSVFTLLQMPNLHIAAKDIIESVRPWMRVVRLLPKQKTIAQNVSSAFNFFTPYLFLVNLMEATEKIDDDQFRSIASLWNELQKSPDHRDLIPLFISDWEKSTTKIKLFGILLGVDPLNVSQRLTNRCSFAFYFHVTRCLSCEFSSEMWSASLLAAVFDRNWDTLLPLASSIIHFAFLFKDRGAGALYNVFCKHLNLDSSNNITSEINHLNGVNSNTINAFNVSQSSGLTNTNQGASLLSLNSSHALPNANQPIVFNTLPKSQSVSARRNSDNANTANVSFSEKYFGIKNNNNNNNFILNLSNNNINNANSTNNSNTNNNNNNNANCPTSYSVGNFNSNSHHGHSHHASSTATKSSHHTHQRQPRGSLIPAPKKVHHQHSHSNAHILFPTQLQPQRLQGNQQITLKQTKETKQKEPKNKDQDEQSSQQSKEEEKEQQQEREMEAKPLLIEPLRKTVDEFVSKLKDEQVSIWAEEALKWIIGCSDLLLATTSLAIFNRLKQNKGPNVIQAIIRTVYYHLTMNVASQSSEPRLLNQLVSESFIMLTNYIEGNELLLYNYVFSFLDCRVFVESSLFEARELIRNCMNVEPVAAKIIANKISIARPLIPRLETSKDAQTVLNHMIKTMPESLELQVIIAPIKSVDPSLFPDAMDVTEMFTKADDSILCKALSHYAFMMKTSSRSVLNSIFDISAEILCKIQQNENNRMSLSKIYQNALHYITQCPNATKFIRVLCKSEPAAATLGVIDMYEWDRSVEDVIRGIKTVLKNDDSPIVTITDCKSYTAVTRFLQPDAMPKILPFAAQREMIEGMKRVLKDHKSNKVIAYRRSPTLYATYAYNNQNQTTRTTSEYFDEVLGNDMQEIEFNPLNHPEKLIMKPIDGNIEGDEQSINADDFVIGIKRSTSLNF